MRVAFAAVAALLMGRFIWVVEWHDVLRFGVPGPRLVVAYAAYVLGAAACGWLLGSLPRFLRRSIN